ncbi:hypothetical protein JCM6882_008622 [Rhodosporidiobolus microsporus]
MAEFVKLSYSFKEPALFSTGSGAAFDWSFNDADLPVDTWKIMMYSEILDFHHIDNTAEAAEGPVAGTAHQQQAPAQ